ncbi:MAG: hypothetical protein IT370_07655, partial [Deltaproteobacteria bacterium]|nr:hypothetical protein [Deltaproteobacteria bacterium]
AATPDAATPDAATPDAATPDAATPDAATPDAGLFCATPPPQDFVGHYQGVATITVYWVDTSGGPSVCIEHRGTTTSTAILDVRRSPGYAMTLSLPGHTPAPHELALDLPGVSHLITHSLSWDAIGAALTTWDACMMTTYWEPNRATFTRNLDTGTARLSTICTASWLDACVWPTNEQTDWTIDLTLTCIPGAATCIDGAIVTCDAAGTVTSSVACGAPCSPCRAPTPDACGTPAAPVCTDLDTDRANCGQCGNACASGELCATGTCVTACVGGTSCPTASPTYCADTLGDTDNCGACGVVCAPGKLCVDGSCACPTPNPDACGSGASAYCTDLTQDESNCQNCGYACLPGQTCSNGACAP